MTFALARQRPEGCAIAEIDVNERLHGGPTSTRHLIGCRNDKASDRWRNADLRLLISTTEHPATVLAGPWIELGTQREGLLQVFDEYAYFGRQPAAGRSNRKDGHSSFEGSEKT